MRKAIGTLLLVWGLSQLLNNSFVAFDRAATASFALVEVTAQHASKAIQQ
jgi:hypothetical protein